MGPTPTTRTSAYRSLVAERNGAGELLGRFLPSDMPLLTLKSLPSIKWGMQMATVTHWTPDLVIALRQKLGLNQSDLARRVGVTTATVSHWETGRRNPSGSAAILLDFLRLEADRK